MLTAKKSESTVPETRDGDQFHYRWAARRCLHLLHSKSELFAISIEGSSNSSENVQVASGELVIDVGEYFVDDVGNNRVDYYQLKHSTKDPNRIRTLSDLEKTILGFAERFRDLKQKLGINFSAESVTFCFVSNYPISTNFAETIEDLSQQQAPRHPTEAKKLHKKIGPIVAQDLPDFLSRLKLSGNQGNLNEQQQLLQTELGEMLGGSDTTSTSDLLQLVTRKATSEGKPNNTIKRNDVLSALGCVGDALFPAPSGIESINAIARSVYPSLVEKIIQSSKSMIHADGGVGKTIFAACIKQFLPDNSVCIVYDCFANGSYRSPSQHRHSHSVALVQIANELASLGLCLPLIPQKNTDARTYLRAFLNRLRQSSISLRAANSDALLCVVVDAADNAQMEANEHDEKNSFAKDLLRETVPEGVCLIFTTRSHRRGLLNPPPDCLQFELPAFDESESNLHLQKHFSESRQAAGNQFHYLTSGNPRVQSMYLRRAPSLDAAFELLGNSPLSIDDAIQRQLESRLADLMDSVERVAIERLCQCIATLRPRIPVSTLAEISSIEASFIRSFASDFYEALQIRSDSIQFTNEPVETWFFDRFKVSGGSLRELVTSILPLARHQPYLARVLPRLMWEADLRTELVSIVLGSSDLPAADAVEARMIEHERLQFALKACLRGKRYADAAKLSFKAGDETAAEERYREIVQKNIDLSSRFRSEQATREYLDSRPFESRWLGSKYVYEAGLLSAFPALQAEARLKHIEAWKWIEQKGKSQKHYHYQKDDLSRDDIVSLAWGAFNLGGANALIEDLGQWTPKRTEFEVGSTIVRKLIEHGRAASATEIGTESVRAKSLGLALATLVELRDANYKPEKSLSKYVFSVAQQVPDWSTVINPNEEHKAAKLRVALRISESALIHRLAKNSEIAEFLAGFIKQSISLPLDPYFRESFNTIFTARVMSVMLRELSIEATNLSDDAFKDLERTRTRSDDYQLHETVRRLAPCSALRIGYLMNTVSRTEAAQAFDAFIAAPAQPVSWSEHYHIQTNSLAVMWLDLLVEASIATKERLKAFELYFANPDFKIWSWRSLAFKAGLADEGGEASISFAKRALDIQNTDFVAAEENCDFLIDLSRAVLKTSEAEAKEYFELAVSLAPSIGMEIIDRWNALAKLGKSLPIACSTKLSKKIAHCAFVSYQYMVRDKYFDWETTIEAMLVLSPASSVAVLSQWRDRGFGSPRRQLAFWVEHALRLRVITAEDAAILFPCRANWDTKRFLDQVLSTCGSETQMHSLANFILGYAMLENADRADLAEVVKMHASKRSHLEQEVEISRSFVDPQTLGFDTSIFAGVDLTSAESLQQLREKSRELRLSSKDFWQMFFSVLPMRDRTHFLDAVAQITDFHSFEYQELIDVIPKDWSSLSVTASLKRLARELCERFCLDAQVGEVYGLSVERLAQLSGQNLDELIDLVLHSLGSTNHVLDSGRIFTSVALLRSKLSHSDTTDVLDFALDILLAKQLNAKSTPARDFVESFSIEQGLACFIWGCLGSIEVTERWEFAHVVCAICDLERVALLDELMQFAASERQDAFVHSEFRFYVEDAKQWLLYALERSASRKPGMVVRCADFLRFMVASSHVIHRSIAARTVLQLQKLSTWEGMRLDVSELTNINCSKLPSIPYGDRSELPYVPIIPETH